jgi:hypothetical protein
MAAVMTPNLGRIEDKRKGWTTEERGYVRASKMPFKRTEAATVKYRVAWRYCLRARGSIPEVRKDQSGTQEPLGSGGNMYTCT